jgi:hypothetical protein
MRRTAAPVNAKLSRLSPNVIYVIFQHGFVLQIDWTTGSEAKPSFMTGSGTARDMDLASIEINQTMVDALLVSENDADGKPWVNAYNPEDSGMVNLFSGPKKAKQSISILRATTDGRYFVGATSNSLVLGVCDSTNVSEFAALHYVTYTFDTSETICALDLKATESQSRGAYKGERKREFNVDVIAGSAQGAIFVYTDLQSKLRSLEQKGKGTENLMPHRVHWHQTAVHALKWSKNGTEAYPHTLTNSFTDWYRQNHDIRRRRRCAC